MRNHPLPRAAEGRRRERRDRRIDASPPTCCFETPLDMAHSVHPRAIRGAVGEFSESAYSLSYLRLVHSILVAERASHLTGVSWWPWSMRAWTTYLLADGAQTSPSSLVGDMMRAIRDLLKRPGGRIVAGVGGAGALVVVAALVAVGVYVFGGHQATTSGAGSPTATLAPTLTPGQGQTAFTIDPSVSSASFEIHEVLFGNPNDVIGKTNQVTGQILINTSDPSKSQMGPIRVDVSTLTTDSDMRNHTLQTRIETSMALRSARPSSGTTSCASSSICW